MKTSRFVETTDPEIDKPIFRRPGFYGIDELGVMDERISVFLVKARATRDLQGKKWLGIWDFRHRCSAAMRRQYRNCT